MSTMKRAEVTTLLAAGISALMGGFAGSWLEHSSRERELDIKMIEVAIGLLKEDPKGPLQPARDWGVELIVKYSDKVGVPLTKEAQTALKSQKVDVFSRIGAQVRPLGEGALGEGALGGN